MNLHKDETLVTVCSALGQITGHFAWPTNCLAMLEFWNASRRGWYFKWEGVDNMSIQDITSLGKQEDPQIRALRLEIERILELGT